jgi:hypothetical protein
VVRFLYILILIRRNVNRHIHEIVTLAPCAFFLFDGGVPMLDARHVLKMPLAHLHYLGDEAERYRYNRDYHKRYPKHAYQSFLFYFILSISVDRYRRV